MTTLFPRRRTSTRGLKGFTSFRESLTTGLGIVLCVTLFIAKLSDECFSVTFLASFMLDWGECFRASTSCGTSIDVFFNCCFNNIWYVKLRSWRNVSLKNKRKARQVTLEMIERNQKMARQLNPVVNAPPSIGPTAYNEESTWDCATTFRLLDQVLEQNSRCPSVVRVKWLTTIPTKLLPLSPSP